MWTSEIWVQKEVFFQTKYFWKSLGWITKIIVILGIGEMTLRLGKCTEKIWSYICKCLQVPDIKILINICASQCFKFFFLVSFSNNLITIHIASVKRASTVIRTWVKFCEGHELNVVTENSRMTCLRWSLQDKKKPAKQKWGRRVLGSENSIRGGHGMLQKQQMREREMMRLFRSTGLRQCRFSEDMQRSWDFIQSMMRKYEGIEGICFDRMWFPFSQELPGC